MKAAFFVSFWNTEFIVYEPLCLYMQKLQEVFKECELPSKDRKQNLSSELGLSFEDVSEAQLQF